MPVSAIRTKIRQEFEKHRYVSQMSVVDVLLYQSHAEFQVSHGIKESKIHTWREFGHNCLSLMGRLSLSCLITIHHRILGLFPAIQ